MGAKFYSHGDAATRRKSRAAPFLVLGGGLLTAGAAWFAFRKAGQTTDAIEEALNATYTPGQPHPEPTVKLRLTGYWPFSATAGERKMEGGLKDRKGNPLHTVEDFLAGKSDHVSLSGDDAVWPYGQKLMIPWKETPAGTVMITGRVTDTGGHFRGAGKVYRVVGYEPIDVCVASSETQVPKTVTATLVPGDNYAKGAPVNTGKLKDQTVAAGEVKDGRTAEDHEAMARAIESELGGHSDDEMRAAAWAIRNRADHDDVQVAYLLMPLGVPGAPTRSGGYASTRRLPTERALRIASEVLDAPAAEDPTAGAVEFWVPGQQDKLKQLGDVHRAALSSGDEARAEKYARYADYGSENDVRQKHAEAGYTIVGSVGVVELLRKKA